MGDIRPQPGFQEKFLSTGADIAFGGGAAGAGKSFAMLLENLRNVRVPGFGAVNFRRTMPQVKNEGGLWDTSVDVYNALPRALRPRPIENSALWRFPGGTTIRFSHLQHEKDMYTWQGAQIPLIGFDELTHFLNSQFWYLLSRNRSTCGVKPYIRATTNPQSRGWVKDMIQWWLYPDDYPMNELRGFPIAERDGIVRYFTRHKKRLLWGDNAEQVILQLPADLQDEYDNDSIKSFTFIGGLLEGNLELKRTNPAYKSNLLAQDETTAMQLLRGRWYSETDEDELYPYAALTDMFTNNFDHLAIGDKYITADIAMEGSDLFVIFVWSGWWATHCYTIPKSDGRQVLEKMQEIARRHSVPASNIAFDSSAIGNFLRGWMKTSMDFRGGDPPEPEGNVKLLFKNFKTQCAYYFANKVRAYEVMVSLNMPGSDEVKERILLEFDSHRKKGLDNLNRLCMTDKDAVKAAIGFSPDFFDALTMRAAFDLRKRTRKRTTTTR